MPTNVSTTTGAVCTGAGAPDAGCTAASGAPPGWLVLNGTTFGGGAASGDTVHQMRFYIEVTGATLAIRVFDPGTGTAAGTNGARDNNTTNITTRYRLLDPAGNPYNGGGGAAEGGPLAIANDAVAGVITEDRLVLFGCVNAAAPAFALTNATNFFGTGSTGGAGCATALQPGLYIFEVTISVDGNAANAFGVQFTNAAGAHYNAYTVGRSDDSLAVVPPAYDNAFVAGRINEGAGTRALITEPMTLYPFIDRSCSFQTSNTDGGLNVVAEGAGATATTTGPDGVVRVLTVSNNNDHSENTLNFISPNGPSYVSTNYGMFPIQHTLGGTTLNNWVDWRVTDSIAWGTSSPGSQPNYGLLPVETYLPNGYTGCNGTTGSCVFTAPTEPIFSTTAVWVSGPNPPIVGSPTVHTITASVYNPTSSALTNLRIVSPLTTSTTYVAATVSTFIDGVASGTPTAPGTAAIGTFATLAAGQTATLQYQVTVTPATAGNLQLTGIPPAQLFGVTGITIAAGPPVVATVTTAGAHGFTINDQVRLAGMNQDGLNGVFQIASTPTATTFTVRVPTPGTVAGTLPAGRLSYAQLICGSATNQPACATFQPAWRSTTGAAGTAADSPGLGSAGPACDLRLNSIGGAVNLSVTNSDAPDPVALGGNIAYSIAVTNSATGVGGNVQWTDTLPSGISFVSLTVPVGWTCTTPQVGASGNVICIRPSMPVSTTDNFTLTAAVNAASATISNTVTVTSSGQEGTPANNTATAVTTVTTGADLRITKAGSPNAQTPLGNVTFTLLVTNLGPAVANLPVVTDTLAGGGPWRFQSVAAPGYSCVTPAVNATGVVTCTRLANLPVGTTDNITLVLSVAAATPVGPITNTATVATSTADPVALNNSSTDTTTVVTTCAPLANGTLTTGIINDYWPGTANAALGATTITLGTRIAGGAGSPITIGDFLMVIQMQDGTFNSTDTDAYGNGSLGDMPSTGAPGLRSPTLAASGSLLIGNVGKFEYVIAANAVPAGGGVLTITAPLKNAYTTSAPAFNAAGSNGQRTFQVVRVPVYNNLTLTGTMSALAWTGTTNLNSGGGVFAIEVNGILTLGGFGIDASNRGFRGGRGLGNGNNNNFNPNHVFRTDTGLGPGADNFGFKGEGINGSTSDLYNGAALVAGVSSYPGGAAADGDRGMGAPGNAGGGGSWDAAGAGGANGGTGGGGGDEYCTAPGCQPGDLSSPAHTVGWTGGRGGLLSFTPSSSQIVMGGGGGGGADHNSADPNRGNGARGGGIIIARAIDIVGTGTINANAANANTPSANGNAGGGGAGGSIIFTESGAGTIPATVTITANGGNGGPSTDHAPGGGGGGGVIFVSPGSLATTSAVGGNNGFRSGTFPGNTNAEPGTDGFTNVMTAAAPPAAADACGPVVDIAVTINAPDTAVAGNNITYPINVTNNGPVAAANTTLIVPVPPNTTFVSFTPPAGWTCSTPLLGGTGSITCSRTGGAMPPITTETFSMVTRVDPGTPAGTVVPATATVSTTSNEDNTANNTYQDNTVIQQTAPPALTRVTIRGFLANRTNGHIEFATGMQRGTSSFNVFAVQDPNNLDRRTLLNVSPILAPFPNSFAPIVYSVDTQKFAGSYILVEETEMSGRQHMMGPFAVGDPKMEASLQRIKTRLSRAGALPVNIAGVDVQFLPSGSNSRMARDVQSTRSILRAQRLERRGRRGVRDGLRLTVTGAGPVSVKRSDLEAEGLPASIKSRNVRLMLYGRSTPFTVVGQGASESILFDAVATDTTYTRQTSYVMMWNGTSTDRPAADLSTESDPLRAGFTRSERSFIYLSGAPQGTDPWLWDLVVGDNTPWPYSYDPTAGDFDLPNLGVQTQPVPVRVKVTAYSPLRHQVRAFINDIEIGSIEFEGSTGGAIDGTVPPGTLRATGNQLSLRYSAVNATFDDPGYLYLDYVEVGAAMTAPAVRVLSTDDIEPFSKILPAGVFNADYIVLSHPDFMAQAERLASLKVAEGRRAVAVDVNRVYDRYSAGFVEAAAIREFLKDAYTKGRLKDLALFGDDTVDYRNFYGLTEFPVVPSLNGWDGEFGRVPSENQFADLDGDGAPDITIGRLPAQTDADADAILAKIRRQQSVLQAQQGRHLIVVDNQAEGDPSFREAADLVVSTFMKRAPIAWSDLKTGVGTARQSLLSGLATAPAVIHYFGHGGPEIWADEQVLTVDDVPSLSTLPEAVYFQWACETQYFPYFFGRSLGEALLLQPNGGALASFGPSGISDAHTQSLFYQLLYGKLSSQNITLGEAIRRAKTELIITHPETRGVVEGFNLIGDPSIRLRGLVKR